MKAVKKAAGGGGGSKSVNMGSKLVDQHRRMATGHMGTVNKMSYADGKAKGVSVKKSKGGKC
jgi:hypothetical protein